MTRKPTIGITIGNTTKDQNFSSYPSYAIRENYADCVIGAGGLPVLLTQDVDLIPDQINLVDGIIFIGGPDYPAAWWGEAQTYPLPTTEHQRWEYDLALMKAYVATKKPFLGICAGEQLLNIVYGGTVIQDIPTTYPDALPHHHATPPHEAAHEITIQPGTLLHSIAGGRESAHINTAHHQAVGKVAPGLIANSWAQDGIIEGIEDPTHPFCLGVQWHPEFLLDPLDGQIFKAFVQAARHA